MRRTAHRENRERNATSHSMWNGSSHVEKTIAMCFEWKRARSCLYQCIPGYVRRLFSLSADSRSLSQMTKWGLCWCSRVYVSVPYELMMASMHCFMLSVLRSMLRRSIMLHVTSVMAGKTCDFWNITTLSLFCYRASFYAFEPEIKTILSKICFHPKRLARIFWYNAKYHQITNKKSHYINLEH